MRDCWIDCVDWIGRIDLLDVVTALVSVVQVQLAVPRANFQFCIHMANSGTNPPPGTQSLGVSPTQPVHHVWDGLAHINSGSFSVSQHVPWGSSTGAWSVTNGQRTIGPSIAEPAPQPQAAQIATPQRPPPQTERHMSGQVPVNVQTPAEVFEMDWAYLLPWRDEADTDDQSLQEGRRQLQSLPVGAACSIMMAYQLQAGVRLRQNLGHWLLAAVRAWHLRDVREQAQHNGA